MKKYGIIGAERTGKTTLAYELAAFMNKKYDASVHVLSETLLRNPQLKLFNETNQYIFLFDQIIRELELERSLGKREIGREIIITDRTPLDIFPYLCEIVPLKNPILFYTAKEMVLKGWLQTFNILLYLEEPLYEERPFERGSDRDHLWYQRRIIFKELIKEISNVDIINVNAIFNNYEYPIAHLSNLIYDNYIGEKDGKRK